MDSAASEVYNTGRKGREERAMEGLTYQWDERGARLETYEWDNVWWEHTEDRRAPRALIVGDSISCGYRGKVNELLAGEVRADGFGTSTSPLPSISNTPISLVEPKRFLAARRMR